MTTYWVTKYAATKGILKREGELWQDPTRPGQKPRYVAIKDSALKMMRLGEDAFDTEKDAIANAIKKVETELQAIERQRYRLESVKNGLLGDLVSAVKAE